MYLYDVPDEGSSKHPVQTEVFILQNILQTTLRAVCVQQAVVTLFDGGTNKLVKIVMSQVTQLQIEITIAYIK